MRGKHWMSYIEVDFTIVVVGGHVVRPEPRQNGSAVPGRGGAGEHEAEGKLGAPTRPYLGQAVWPGRERDSRQQDRIGIASSKRSHLAE
jgi:hypothetical protein